MYVEARVLSWCLVCCEEKLPVVSFACHVTAANDVARIGTTTWYKEKYIGMYKHQRTYCRRVVDLSSLGPLVDDLSPIYALSTFLETSFMKRTKVITLLPGHLY